MTKDVKLVNLELYKLILDYLNPRIENKNNEFECLKSILLEQDKKIITLAESISQQYIPTDNLYIIKIENKEKYIVLEGNRRLVCLSLLNNPELIKEDKELKKFYIEFTKLSQNFNLPKTISCLLFNNREEADYFIKLRHTGQNEGAGIVPWDLLQKERFEKPNSSALKIFDLIKKHHQDFNEKEVEFSTFQRLFGYLKNKLYEEKGEDFYLKYNEIEISNFFKKFTDDIIKGEQTSRTLNNKNQQEEYIEKLKKENFWPKTSQEIKYEFKKKDQNSKIQFNDSSLLFPLEGDENDKRQKIPKSTIHNKDITDNDEIKAYLKNILINQLKNHREKNIYRFFEEFLCINYTKSPTISIICLRTMTEVLARETFEEYKDGGKKCNDTKIYYDIIDKIFNSKIEIYKIIKKNMNEISNFTHGRIANKDYKKFEEYFNSLKSLFEELLKKY